MKRKYSQEEVQQCMSGRIYANPDDLNIFVKRKVPYSWTMNLGNKWSWVIMTGVVVFIVMVVWIVLGM